MNNWLQKISAPIRTEDLPDVLAKALEYEIGGKWEAGPAKPWTEDLEKITNDPRLSQEKGYSTSFWVSCETGDGLFGRKWGVSVNFTVISGSSNTVFDSETGDWDFSITANVQSAYPSAWTPAFPYALFSNRPIGHQEDMKTIQEFANFVKMAIWKDQTDEDEDGDDGNDDPQIDPTPDPVVGVPVGSPQLVGGFS